MPSRPFPDRDGILNGLGVAIVTYDAGAVIERALAHLAAQTRRPDRVVLVDNASRDDTLARVRRHAATVALELELIASPENLGFAAGNNLAVNVLDDCPLVALLNPDAFPEPEWLARLEQAAAAHPEAAAFASRLMVADRPGFLDGAGDVYHVSGLVWRHGHGEPLSAVPEALTSHAVFSACAGAALYRRDDWLAVGGFDERFFCYLEDVDLGFRLQLAGRTCWYVADAVAHHVGSASSGVGSDFAVYHGHRNLEWVFLKNLPARSCWRYGPLHLLMWIAGLATMTWQGRGRTFLRAKMHALARLPEVLRARRSHRPVLAPAQVDALLDRSSLWLRMRRRAGRPTSEV